MSCLHYKTKICQLMSLDFASGKSTVRPNNQHHTGTFSDFPLVDENDGNRRDYGPAWNACPGCKCSVSRQTLSTVIALKQYILKAKPG